MLISFSRLRAGVKAQNKGHEAFGSGVYFTPSIIYASHPRYANPMKISDDAESYPGKWVQVVLNFRIKPNSFEKHRQTLGHHTNKIDPNYNNDELEWFVPLKSGDYINENNAILCGYMIRVSDNDPIELASSNWWYACGAADSIRLRWYEYSKTKKTPTIFYKDEKGNLKETNFN